MTMTYNDRMTAALEQLGATQYDTAYLAKRAATMAIVREAEEFIALRRADRRERRNERRFKAASRATIYV